MLSYYLTIFILVLCQTVIIIYRYNFNKQSGCCYKHLPTLRVLIVPVQVVGCAPLGRLADNC